MAENWEAKSDLQAVTNLQDEFSRAHFSQGMLEDVPPDSLPDEYRSHILLRSDPDHFYVAFSDDSENLEPTEEGHLPNAHLIKISVMNGPRRTGLAIKGWIDSIREAEYE